MEQKEPNPIFAVLKNAVLVKGLRRLPFTEESRVRIPYMVQKGTVLHLVETVLFYFLPNTHLSCISGLSLHLILWLGTHSSQKPIFRSVSNLSVFVLPAKPHRRSIPTGCAAVFRCWTHTLPTFIL